MPSERYNVVTLLHLAAVLADEGQNWPPILCEAEKLLGLGNGHIMDPSPACLFAQRACEAANSGRPLGFSNDRAETCRKAAVMVASGAWPTGWSCTDG